MTLEASLPEVQLRHTFNHEGKPCPACPGKSGEPARCDHSGYSQKMVRFVLAHLDVYLAAYVCWGSESVRNQLARLEAEYHALPRFHDCTCWARHCSECRRLDQQRPQGPDVAVTIGRTGMVEPPVPSVLMLDLFRAVSALRTRLKRKPTVSEVVRMLNEGEG